MQITIYFLCEYILKQFYVEIEGDTKSHKLNNWDCTNIQETCAVLTNNDKLKCELWLILEAGT